MLIPDRFINRHWLSFSITVLALADQVTTARMPYEDFARGALAGTLLGGNLPDQLFGEWVGVPHFSGLGNGGKFTNPSVRRNFDFSHRNGINLGF
jgi:hypothetical protein